MGCDYCESIRGVGPKRALELIAQYKSIEEILNNIDTKKYIVPEGWNYQQARKLFVEPVIEEPSNIDVSEEIETAHIFTFQLLIVFLTEKGSSQSL